MPSWNWDEATSESGVVHQSTANTDHDDSTKLKQGYDYANFSEITPDPVACWPLHEDSGSTANDVAGTNDGTIGGATIGQTGLLGTTAYSFDGADDDVGYPTTDVSDISVFAWVKLDDRSGRYAIVKEWVGGGNRQFFMDFEPSSSNTIGVGTNGGNGTDSFNGNVEIQSGTWTHVGFTYDGSTVTIYVDGSSDNTSNGQSGSLSTPPSTGYIGSEDSSTRYFKGDIADVRIYDTGLTASEVQTLYDVVDTTGEWVGSGKTL